MAEDRAALVASNARLRALLDVERDRSKRYLDTAEVILLALDVTGRITLVNRYACTVFGCSAEELVGHDFIETCVPTRLREETRAKLGQVLAGSDSSIVENLIVTRSGEERLFEWRNTLLRGGDGQVISTFSSGTDITARIRSEEAARLAADGSARAEGEFRLLFAANPLPMWIYDLETLRFLEVNEAAVQLYGYRPAEFLAMTIKDIRPPGDVERLLTDVAQQRENWQDAGGWQHRIKAGRIIDVQITSHTITFAGRPAALVVVQEITERKRAEEEVRTLGIERQRSIEALRIAEERTRFAMEAAGVGIWDMDYATGVIQWSAILESQYGLKPGALGQTFGEFLAHVHPDDREAVGETIAKATRLGTGFSVLHRVLWPDGTVRWLSVIGRIQLGEDGHPWRGTGISLDVTDRRNLEVQFQQAQKMEAIGRLAGGVAHDFNNLLTTILGYCELLLTDLDPGDPRTADIAEIQKAGVSAAGLTRQLLAFSRKEIIELKILDLNEVVTHVRVMLGRLIGEDVKVVLALRPDLGPVKADHGQVEQIVLNLAVNARDAMPDGGTLTIETANVELDENYAEKHFSVTPGPYVALTVTDTGTGITPAVQARLFEPFFTTKEPGRGTGLGLATVHGIVARSGGSVTVYSEIGRGTSFKVYLPRADASELAVAAPPPVSVPNLGSQTVLLVEDAEGLRELTRKLLKRQGYTVLVAGNVEEAVQLFAENAAIDVLLTDVVMPGGSGPELARRLIEQRPALKVVYMSGYTEETILYHGVLNPGIAFLHKPFTSDTLAKKLREVLEQVAVG